MASNSASVGGISDGNLMGGAMALGSAREPGRAGGGTGRAGPDLAAGTTGFAPPDPNPVVCPEAGTVARRTRAKGKAERIMPPC